MFINLQYRNARGLIRSSKPDSASTPIIDLVCCSYDSYKSHSESKLKGDGIRLYFRFKGNQSSVEAMAKRENVRAKLFIFRYTSFPWLLSMHFFGLEFVNSVLISSVTRKALNPSPLHFTKFRSACLLALPPALRGNHFIPPTSGNFIINYFQFYFSIIFFVQQE